MVADQEVWQEGTVLASEPLVPGVRRISIRPSAPVRADAGAHVDVRIPIDGTVDRRSYSIVDASERGDRIDLAVFESPRSRGGAAVMHGLAPGDVLALTQPLHGFPLRIGAPQATLLAGGIGITAIRGMASVLRRVGADYRFVYVGRGREHMAFLDELEAEHGDRLEVRSKAEGRPLDVGEVVDAVTPGGELYMCGPIRLMDAVRRAWADRGLPPARLRFETFGNSGWFDAEPFVVRIPSTGIEAVVGPGQTMLEALEGAGADLMYDCRKGECGLCEVRITRLEGRIDHRDVFYSERQKDSTGKMCCCVSRVVAPSTGERAVVTIEAH